MYGSFVCVLIIVWRVACWVMCLLMFLSRDAAETFLQNYGGSNYDGATEQFKSIICQLYDVEIDRGIERVYIRIEHCKQRLAAVPFPLEDAPTTPLEDSQGTKKKTKPQHFVEPESLQ